VSRRIIAMTVDGLPVEVMARADETLLEALRREVKAFSVREACGLGVCGSCTIVVDGRQVSSCLMLAPQAEGSSIETVASMSEGSDLGTIQEAYVEHNAFQCSYCTPGFLLATRELLHETPSPTRAEIREYLAGNLCRCGSYLKIEEAVLDAAQRLRGGDPRPGGEGSREPA
jgi:aerobic-type carbon monoxide dehydrogenase small subunit (CoxS/CutS family)